MIKRFTNTVRRMMSVKPIPTWTEYLRETRPEA